MAPSRMSRLVHRTKRALSRGPHKPGQPAGSAYTEGHPQGLEVVYEGDNPIIDIVALHGLNGHRQKTWTAKNGVHWLRDLLPEDLTQARILCWGYDANTHAANRVSWQYLYDHAKSLVSDLCSERQLSNCTERPIIFIAHSLGGIVLKSALIHSDAARAGALVEHRSIKLSTCGIFFMGTPHQGGNGVQLGRVLANVASLVVPADDRLLKHLERDSEWLQQQLGQYGTISNDFETKYAFEEYATPTALGHSIMVVPKASAVVPGHANAEPIAINSNHTSMVRYESRQDPGYVKVSQHLRIMARNAPEVVQQRWDSERRMDDARGNLNRFVLPLSLSGVAETTHFVAREEDLAWIHERLSRSPGRHTAIVHGLGGIGKTQLAIAYMKRHRNNYTALIWLNARDETSLKQSFRDAARRILQESPTLSYMHTAVSDKDSDASLAVKRWLDEAKNDQWLLVYDNYDNPKLGGNAQEAPVGESDSQFHMDCVDQEGPDAYDIRPFLPDTDHGAVIVTTRSSTIQIGELRRLQKLRKEDSLRILESTSGRSNIHDDAAAVLLAHKLDGLPLALSTAGMYMAEVSATWEEYLQEYESAWVQLQKLSPRLLAYENRAMYSTWNISYASIRRQSESAAMLLRLWAFFGHEDLWYELLRQGREDAPKWFQDLTESRLEFHHVMRILCSHGLAEVHSTATQVGSESSGYSVHGCVHSWMIHVLAAEKKRDLAGLSMECIAPHIPNHEVPEYWLIQRRLLFHADRCRQLIEKNDDTGIDPWIPGRLARLYADQGRFREAETMYNRALQGKEKVWGAEHMSTLDTVHNFATLYANQGRLQKAEAMYNRALEGFEKAWGPEHTSTLETVNGLAILYANQGRLQEAEAMYNRALKGCEKAWGPEHTSTLDIVNNLAILYANQGRLQEAEAMYNRTLEGFKKAWRPEHTSTLETVNNLAVLYYNQGRLQEAEVMYNRALKGKEKAWGPEHTSTLDTVNNLATLYDEQGRLQEAEAMYNRALKGFKKARGPEHTSTLDTVNNLAILYANQGRLQEAEAMFNRALQGREKAWGPEHTSTLKTVNNLATLYANQGRFQEAEVMYNRALQGKEKAWGPEHTSTLDTVNNLATLYDEQGRLQEAEAMYNRALKGGAKV
ncbi:nephrocystin-3 [Microdochium nivale]|nr:nephrocystin-3 [Microdochium nivale]